MRITITVGHQSFKKAAIRKSVYTRADQKQTVLVNCQNMLDREQCDT